MDIKKIGGMELNRLKRIEAEAAVPPATTTDPAATPEAPKDNPAVLDKATIVNQADLGKSQQELEALYTKYDKDGTDGLSDDEFSQLVDEALAAAPAEPKTYTVKSGDSLSKIAKEMTGQASKYKELYELNKDTIGKDPNLIRTGAQLKIPQSWQKDAPKAALTDEQLAAAEQIEKITSGELPEAGSLADQLAEDGTPKKDAEGKVDPRVAKLQEDVGNLSKALEKYGEKTPGRKALEDKLSAYEDAVQAAFTPKTETPATTTTTPTGTGTVKVEDLPTYDDETVMADLQAKDDTQLDAMKPELRIAYAKSLQEGYTTNAEVDQIARLAGSVARTNPESLPQVVDHMDDNAVREFMKQTPTADLYKLPSEALDKMIGKVQSGITTGTEDEISGKLTKILAFQGKLTPEMVDKMDDNAVREFMRQFPEEYLPNVPAATMDKMLEKVETGYTTSEEDAIAGNLTNAMALQGTLTPETINKMDDNGVRELINSLPDDKLALVSPDALKAAIVKLDIDYTSDEEYKLMGRSAAAIVRSNPSAFTSDLARTLGDNGTRELVSLLTPNDLKNLPTQTISSLIKELDAGWTTDFERSLISRLNDAINLK